MAPLVPPCRWHLGLDLLIPASPMSTLWPHSHSWLSLSRTLRSVFASSCRWHVLSPWSLHTEQRADLWRVPKGLQIKCVSAPGTETSAPGTLAGESEELVSRGPLGDSGVQVTCFGPSCLCL